MFNKFLHLPWIAWIILLISSCSKMTDCTDDFFLSIPGMDYFSSANLTTIKIVSSRCTNQGAPFYVIIKTSDFATYVTEDYEKITHTVIHPKHEEGSFEFMCVLPGKELDIEIETPQMRSLGIYFLFTNPGKNWKCFLQLEDCCNCVKVVLDENQIISVEK